MFRVRFQVRFGLLDHRLWVMGEWLEGSEVRSRPTTTTNLQLLLQFYEAFPVTNRNKSSGIEGSYARAKRTNQDDFARLRQTMKKRL